MMSRARRVYGDALVSAGVLLAVLGVLVSADDRVREQMSMAARGAMPSTFAEVGTRLHEIATAVIDAAHTQSLDHAPLMIFVVAATVLVLFMGRT